MPEQMYLIWSHDHIPAGEEVAIRDFGRNPIDYIHGRKS